MTSLCLLALLIGWDVCFGGETGELLTFREIQITKQTDDKKNTLPESVGREGEKSQRTDEQCGE